MNHPTLRAGLLLFLLALSLGGCGGGDSLVVTVMDTAKQPIQGVEIRVVGENSLLATTNPQGEATLPLPKTPDLSLRLLLPGDDTYTFESSYSVDAADRRIGKKLIRVEAGRDNTPITASLRVSTTPTGASISLNGTASGTTDTVLRDLPVGRMRVAIELQGMHPDTVDMYLVAGENELTRTLRPAEITTARLVVNSSPTGASVVLNGKKTDQQTPAVFDNLKPGRYAVKIQKSGFTDYSAQVSLQAGKEGSVHSGPLAERGTSRPRTAPEPTTASDHVPGSTRSTFTVKPYPGYAEVYVDGDSVNRNLTGAFQITLPDGKHRFHVRNQGIDVVLEYTVRPNDPNTVLLLRYEEGQVEARK